MDFIKFELGKALYRIKKDNIGNWSVTPHTCDKCGMEKYILDIYDNEGRLLYSLDGCENEIKNLNSEIENEVFGDEKSN